MPIAHKDVTWVEEPEFGFWEATFLPAIAAGLRTTIDHIKLNRPVTQQYPEVKPDLPQHYRGVHRLNRDEKGRVKCVACMLCATACPANCIAIEAAPAPPDWPDRDKFPATFVLDELRCIYCGMCEEACPVDAIELTHIYDLTATSREEMLFNKEKLLDVYDETKNDPRDPVRTGRGRLGPASEFQDLHTLGPATEVEDKDRAAKSETPGAIGKAPKDRYDSHGTSNVTELMVSMDWISNNLLFLASLVLMALGVWWLMPSSWPRSRVGGWLMTIVGGALAGAKLHVATGPIAESILFWTFALGALLCAVLMITSRKPVYAALWFALVTFSTCGLFLLQSAPFLAAATIIVYAGAIIVTFLFVMMLAQQAGATVYDQRARQPFAATVIAFILLGALLYTLKLWDAHRAMEEVAKTRDVVTANPLSRPAEDQPIDTMDALGRSLFGDYLFAVELGGTVLLIAAIGAIAIAPRRAEGTL